MKSRACVLWLGLLALFGTPARLPAAQNGSSAAKVMELPLMLARRNYLFIPVQVNGVSQHFLLDTAGGGLSITPATRNSLGYTDRDGTVIEGQGASGSHRVQVIKLSSVFLLGKYPLGGTVSVLDLKGVESNTGEHIAGILGNGILRYFDVKIDIPNRRLLLYRVGLDGKTLESAASGKIPFENFQNGMIKFTVKVNDLPVTAILDTGATHTVINWKAANALGVTMQSQGVERLAQGLSGFDKNVVVGYSYNFDLVEVGRLRYAGPKLVISDLPAFKTLGIGDQPAMLFGMDFLRDSEFYISYTTGQLAFSTPAK